MRSRPQTKRRGRGILPALLVSVAALLPAAPVSAHGPIHEQIAEASRRIAANPLDAELRLRRGELHRAHGDFDAALADDRCALEIDPRLDPARLAAATAELEAGHPDAALVALDRFLAKHPDHSRGRALRAKALAALGRTREAVAELDRAIEVAVLAGTLRPDELLERARLLVSLSPKNVPLAISELDEGSARLGSAVTLELAALEIELRFGRWNPALARVTRLEAMSDRKSSWIARRAGILDRAGRPREARAEWRRASESLDREMVGRGESPKDRELRGEIARALGEPRSAGAGGGR